MAKGSDNIRCIRKYPKKDDTFSFHAEVRRKGAKPLSKTCLNFSSSRWEFSRGKIIANFANDSQKSSVPLIQGNKIMAEMQKNESQILLYQIVFSRRFWNLDDFRLKNNLSFCMG
jgi:hypothetical protein